MSAELTDLQKKLCEALQDSLPLCSRPFAELAAFLGTDEQTILNETLALRNCGVIRRLGPFIDYHALGRVSALVAGHVDENMLAEVVKLVNAQPGVSHNYLRGHHYNLWFTLQADSAGKIEQILTSLTAETGVTFHRLPAIRSFKLDVR
ncbi:MAG TPA: hypothetical protein VLH60_02200, partial [Sedimentisphaerales bacterium]|nr:hypothetical protein [Sedimentisphaerales bacterium]